MGSAFCQGPRDDCGFPRWRREKEHVESEKLRPLAKAKGKVCHAVGVWGQETVIV